MAALDFPASPVDGQSFTSNGITYYYNANIDTWLTQLVNTNVGASGNTQVLFNDAGVSNGSFGITFDKGANTVSVNQLVTSGSLGVGTNTPGYKLTVRSDNASQTNWIGSVNYSAAGAYGAGVISTVAATNYSYLYQSGAGNTYLLNYYPGNMIFSTNNATRMMISANGNIGMGYTNMDALAARLYCYGYSGFGASNNGSISLGSRVNWTSTFENNSGGYGLGVNVNAATGVVRLQSQRFDGTATSYNMALQDLGGNVGIGTTTPGYKLHVEGETFLGRTDSSTEGGQLSFARSSDNSLLYAIDVNGAGSSPEFRLLNQAGGVVFFSAAPAGVNYIKFNPTQMAIGDANVLDDYEEGTWTPVLKFGGNNTGMVYTSFGKYTKVGDIVYIYGKLTMTNKGSSTGTANLSGLPFVVNGNSQGTSFAFYVQNGQLVIGTGLIPEVYAGPNSTGFDINYVTQSSGVDGNYTQTNFGTTGSIYFSGVYYI